MRRRRVDLAERIEMLSKAVDLSAGRIPDEVVDRARAVLDRADQRCQIGGDHTVIALAGATGSGKSSTFNALAGADLADPGVRRPTTGLSTAWCCSTCPTTTRCASSIGWRWIDSSSWST